MSQSLPAFYSDIQLLENVKTHERQPLPFIEAKRFHRQHLRLPRLVHVIDRVNDMNLLKLSMLSDTITLHLLHAKMYWQCNAELFKSAKSRTVSSQKTLKNSRPKITKVSEYFTLKC